MHIGYAARAAQKGRTPEAPGYFLKPATSLSPGGEVERAGRRPRSSASRARSRSSSAARCARVERGGCVGARRRRHRRRTTWACSTCAGSDKGANVRSKGGDGYTAIGPRAAARRGTRPGRHRDPDLARRRARAGRLHLHPALLAAADRQRPVAARSRSSPATSSSPARPRTRRPSRGRATTVEVEVEAAGRSTGRLVSTAVRVATAPLPAYCAQPKPRPSSGRTHPAARSPTSAPHRPRRRAGRAGQRASRSRPSRRCCASAA